MHGPKYQLQNIQELCRSNKLEDEEPEIPTHRVDKFGNQITKKHGYRISFRDEVLPASQLHDIHVVENWKLYNIIEENEPHDVCHK